MSRASSPVRVIAIDWSGAASGASKRIWLAEVRDSRLRRLESGRSREEIAEHLIQEAQRDPNLIVGLDFAFSFPSWFLEEVGVPDVRSLWSEARTEGEKWLAACEPPFWGRPGRTRPVLREHFRRTEREAQAVAGSQPKSVFQIGGAGAVGTGSLRGMPTLARLAAGGFAIWPFDDAHLPMVVEIYPRLLTGAVKKSNSVARFDYLASGFPELGPAQRVVAASSEDALDAAVSAIVMGRNLNELTSLGPCRDHLESLEGRIWWPEAATSDCPFCSRVEAETLAANESAVAIADRYPVAEGHTLVIPRSHASSIFDLSRADRGALWDLVARVRAELEERFTPDGFTIGVNDGVAAGQTVSHAHVHVIPRYEHDVADPRGGVRWVIPERAAYWET